MTHDGRPLVLIAHGLLASGRAWRSIARRLTDARPDLAFHTVDLRGHGDARGRPGPHTVAQAADDLRQAVEGPFDGAPVAALIGHSFGGKVVLAAHTQGLPSAQVWCLDSDPTAGRPSGPDDEVERVLALVRALPSQPTAAAVAEAFGAAGFEPGFVAWMTSNLEPGPGPRPWRFELETVDALRASYRATDLSDAARHPAVHLVRGGRSDRWSPAGLDLFAALGPARAHLLPDAGHWLHVDAAGALIALLAERLPQ